MLRVKPSIENMNDASKYEFFGGHDHSGDLGQVIADNPPGSHYGMVLQEIEFQ